MAEPLAFEEVVSRLASDPLVIGALRARFSKATADDLIVQVAAGETPECDGVYLPDFLDDLLGNEGRLYRRFTARGSYGNYYIDIRGLGGVYFYEANEFGSTGYFLSIEEADSAVTSNWMDCLVSSTGRSYREAFVDVAAEKAAAIAALEENTRRAKAFLNTQASNSDWDVWEILTAGPVPDDSAICAGLAGRYHETIPGGIHVNLPSEQQRPLWWLMRKPVLTITGLLAIEGDAITSAVVAMIAFQLSASKKALKRSSGPARMGAAANVHGLTKLAKAVDAAMHSARLHSNGDK
jgi:hypothetical protein